MKNLPLFILSLLFFASCNSKSNNEQKNNPYKSRDSESIRLEKNNTVDEIEVKKPDSEILDPKSETPNPNERFIITAQIANLTGGTVYLEEIKSQNEFRVINTTQVDTKGKFGMNGKVMEPSFYRLRIANRGTVVLVLDNHTMHITADANDLNNTFKIKGSKDTELLREIDRMIVDFQNKVKAVNQKYQSAMIARDNNAVLAIQQEYNSLQANNISNVKKFINVNTGSVVAVYVALNFLNLDNDFIYLDNVKNIFEKKLPGSKFTKDLVQRINSVGGSAIGRPAPDITMYNTKGKPVSLSSFKGKYVLVDFWASWCRPCRVENPNVVKAYLKYKDKGFEIFGVSLDNNKARWIQAIQADGLVWTHVSDLKGWKSSAAVLYNVKSIPATFLLDKQGRIIAKNLRGRTLESKLAEIYKGQ